MTIEEVTADTIEAFVTSCDIILLDFTATWCSPCGKMGLLLHELDGETNPPIKIGKVDIDQNSQLAEEFGVESVPAIALYSDGKLVGRKENGKNKTLYVGYAPGMKGFFAELITDLRKERQAAPGRGTTKAGKKSLE